jgi:hypothetical protein
MKISSLTSSSQAKATSSSWFDVRSPTHHSRKRALPDDDDHENDHDKEERHREHCKENPSPTKASQKLVSSGITPLTQRALGISQQSNRMFFFSILSL